MKFEWKEIGWYFVFGALYLIIALALITIVVVVSQYSESNRTDGVNICLTEDNITINCVGCSYGVKKYCETDLLNPFQDKCWC